MEQEDSKELKNTLTQDEVLLTALKLFSEKGYFNTSMTDIKAALETTSTTAISQHFKTKQAIADALCESILDSLSISIDDIRRRNKKASEQLREIVDLMFRLTDEAPEVMRFLLLLRIEEFLPDQRPVLASPPFKKIKKIFHNGIKDGEIKPLDPVLAYTYFFGIIRHVLQMVLTGELESPADSYQSQVWLAAWGTVAKK